MINLLDEINKLNVFEIKNIKNNTYNIKTDKVIAKVNYMKLKKMNNNQYMKKIDFTAELTQDDLIDLIKISIKTNKTSQDVLVKNKLEEVKKKYTKKYELTKQQKEDYEIDVNGYILND